MPQLWIETFVSQYFWLLLILFTFYYFITVTVIPTISETLKARQISDNKETKIVTDLDVNEKAVTLFNNNMLYTDIKASNCLYKSVYNNNMCNPKTYVKRFLCEWGSAREENTTSEYELSSDDSTNSESICSDQNTSEQDSSESSCFKTSSSKVNEYAVATYPAMDRVINSLIKRKKNRCV